MRLGIGIDTGGTCTDAVLYDYEEKKVLASAKALTTRQDLSVGIQNALNALPSELVCKAETLALSTTLATNACVEDKGGRARLVLYGTDKEYAMRVIGNNGTITADDLICYDTHTSCDGEIRNMPDWDEMRELLKEKLKDCQAAAVVEIYSRKTGAVLERTTQELLLGTMDLPVVCGFELFHELDFIKRGASCLLNARLIPLIDTFLKAVEKSAMEKGIDCQPVIVRSDGTLMSREFARIRPVETLLCGPVASLMGAQELTETKDAVIIDMGGTTTDVAFLNDNEPLRVNGGIHIGNWDTFVKGLFVDTFALGGDSGIRYDMKDGIHLDNRRVFPLCVAAETWPFIREELREMAEMEVTSTRSIYEYYILQQPIDDLPGFNEEEREICHALEAHPLSRMNLCRAVNLPVYDLPTAHLESENIIMRAGLTPTDIMHVVGDYTAFQADVSEYAVTVLANCVNKSVKEICDISYLLVKEKLFANLARILLERQFAWVRREGIGPQLQQMIHDAWNRYLETKKSGFTGFVSPMFHTESAFIGIGGPIHIFLKDVAEAFGTKAVIPEHAAVANAIGAAVCEVAFTITVHVTPTYNSTGGIILYTVYSPGDAKEYLPEDLEAAMAYGRERAKICAEEEAVKRGLSEIPDITITERSTIFSGLNSTSDILIEATV